ncbi:MAG: glycosyltransferase [Azospirillaceae bacterium]
MADKLGVTVLIHTRNSAETLPRLLASIDWAAEIVIIDMHSTDGTAAIAEAAGALVVEIAPHPRVDDVRDAHLDEGTQDWVMVLDSDEYLPDDAKGEIARLIAPGVDHDVVAVPRYNWIGDHRLEGSGFYPDHQIRIFRRGTVRWPGGTHKLPQPISDAMVVRSLEPPNCLHIHHPNYRDLAHFIAKQAAYAAADSYEPPFDLTGYLLAAHRAYAQRLDSGKDGDLSVALATVMAWDQVMRALVHWDREGRTAPLPDIFSLPLIVERESPGWWTRLWRRLRRRR